MRLPGEIAAGPLRGATLAGGREILDRLAGPWEALCDEGPSDAPFYRPAWIRTWYEAFCPGARLRVVVAWRGDRLRGLLPLVECRGRMRGVPIRLLRGAANVHSCRFDLIRGAGDGEAAVSAIWRELARSGGWDVIEIPDVPEGGSAEGLVRHAASEGHPTGRWESMRSPFVPLGGGADPLAGTDAKFRSNLRRRRRRLEERGALELRRFDRFDPQALQAFYDLERSGWKGRVGTAIACAEATRRFYDGIARWAGDAGCLSLYALLLEGRPVAMHFGLEHGGRYLLPKPAYDERHGDCSPGQLLVQAVLADCAARGLREFDFLGPSMEWKGEWTDRVRPHAFWYVFRRGPVGRALHAAKFGIAGILARS